MGVQFSPSFGGEGGAQGLVVVWVWCGYRSQFVQALRNGVCKGGATSSVAGYAM